MRKFPFELPSTTKLKGDVLEFVNLFIVELESFKNNLDKYIGRMSLKSLTAAATLTANDDVALCNGTFTVTLPPAAATKGRSYYIKNVGSGTITIDGNSSETIDGSTTKSLTQYQHRLIVSDGTEWWIICE